MQRSAHQMKLLAAGRCGRCAERVLRTAIMRESDCNHCDSVLSFNGSDILQTLQSHQHEWRVRGYALVAVVINVAIAPLFGVSAVILGLLAPLLTALYVEGGLVILRKRWRLETEHQPLTVLEWALRSPSTSG